MIWLKNPTILFDPKRLKYYMPGPNLTWEEQANAMLRFIIYLSLILYLYYKNPLMLIVPPLLMIGVQYYLYQEGKLQKLMTKMFNARLDDEELPSQQEPQVEPSDPMGSNKAPVTQTEDQLIESFMTKEKPDEGGKNIKEHLNMHISNPFLDDPNMEPMHGLGPRPDLGLERPEQSPRPITADCKKPTSDNPFGNSMPYDPIEKQVKPVCPNEFEKDERFYDKLFHSVDDLFDRNNSQRQFTTNPASTRINDREAAIQFFYNTPYTEH